MEDAKIRKLVMSALFASLVFAATMVIRLPSPTGGYVNLGDCFVLLSGWLLGPWYGAAAAGIGSMLTDLLAGYTYYVPATLIIKAVDAMVAALIFRAMERKRGALLISGIAGELIMIAGYFGFTALLLGKGFGALLSVPGDLVQGVTGIMIGIILMKLFENSNTMKKLMK
ncbi:MAG: ECF transporter S component [Eubacteriales bacterium]|nr:ECF transporter S component [Eubacteriales bacterium]